jgi:hypothetical protein
VTNLFPSEWQKYPLDEVLSAIGFHYRGSSYPGENFVGFPATDASEQIRITFAGEGIESILPGPAFDPDDWKQVLLKVEDRVSGGDPKFGSGVCFSAYPVDGCWRSAALGIQIRPAPETAPRPRSAMADHPFIVEFPFLASEDFPISMRRRLSEYRRLSLCLNLLLAPGVRHSSPRLQNAWVFVVDDTGTETRWAQMGYDVGPGFEFIGEKLPEPTGSPLEVVPAEAYYRDAFSGIEMGRGLEVPDSLEESLTRFVRLDGEDADRFFRALFWLELHSRQWNLSESASFGSLATAIETLMPPPAEGVGPTRHFRDLLEKFAPGGGDMEKRRSRMYGVRSAISHGGKLLRGDLHWFEGGLIPTSLDERSLHSDLLHVTRVALINWLYLSS